MMLFNRVILGLALVGVLNLPAAASSGNLGRGDQIDAYAFVDDMSGQRHRLVSLLGQNQARLNLIYLFGGGDMGDMKPGRLWCPDSVQDAYIIRSLYAKYAGHGVNFILIAVPPVYHPDGAFQVSARALLNESPDSRAYQAAERAFAESTLAAYRSGTLPVEPYLDLDNRLMMNPDPALKPGAAYGPIFPWQGSFRDPSDQQRYGVPSLWLVDNQGRVVAPPLRGNQYFNDGKFRINYGLTDVDDLIQTRLNKGD